MPMPLHLSPSQRWTLAIGAPPSGAPQEGVTYFVTARQCDSIPQEKLRQWGRERNQWLIDQIPFTVARRLGIDDLPDIGQLDWKTTLEYFPDKLIPGYHQRFTDRFQASLNAGHGAHFLRHPDADAIVAGALRFFNETRHMLGRFVGIPNHVHVLVTPICGHELSDIRHSWKSFTSLKINNRFNRRSQFWQE